MVKINKWTQEETARRLSRALDALKKITALPHSNPSGDTLHGLCPKCVAETAIFEIAEAARGETVGQKRD